jgi:outer membrane protein assembly factor BamB
MTALLLTLLLAAAPAADLGWRRDGTGDWPEVVVPRPLEQHLVWSVKTSTWGNASPLVVRDQVCITEEPTTLRCLALADGAARWSATSDYRDTLTGAALTAWDARLAELEPLRAELQAKRQALAELRREQRRGADVDLTAASAALDALKARLDALAPYLTPPPKDIIGYASPTPVTDGTTVWALFGNGVVSAFTHDGKRRWSRHLGAGASGMLGYEDGTTASPVLVDGVLVVGHGALHGLDPATGAVRWKDARPWRNYGPPAVLRVAGKAFLATADGRVLRATDGVEVARGLPEIWFAGPVARNDVGWWIGGRGRADDPDNFEVHAFRFELRGDVLHPTPLWTGTFPAASRVYMSPALHGDRLMSVTHHLDVVLFNATTGALIAQRSLAEQARGTGYQGAIHLKGGWLVLDDRGHMVGLDEAGQVLWVETLPGENRSTPAFHEGWMLLRMMGEVRGYRG